MPEVSLRLPLRVQEAREEAKKLCPVDNITASYHVDWPSSRSPFAAVDRSQMDRFGFPCSTGKASIPGRLSTLCVGGWHHSKEGLEAPHRNSGFAGFALHLSWQRRCWSLCQCKLPSQFKRYGISATNSSGTAIASSPPAKARSFACECPGV